MRFAARSLFVYKLCLHCKSNGDFSTIPNLPTLKMIAICESTAEDDSFSMHAVTCKLSPPVQHLRTSSIVNFEITSGNARLRATSPRPDRYGCKVPHLTLRIIYVHFLVVCVAGKMCCAPTSFIQFYPQKTEIKPIAIYIKIRFASHSRRPPPPPQQPIRVPATSDDYDKRYVRPTIMNALS